VVAVGIAAVLAGARSFVAVAEWLADQDDDVLSAGDPAGGEMDDQAQGRGVGPLQVVQDDEEPTGRAAPVRMSASDSNSSNRACGAGSAGWAGPGATSSTAGGRRPGSRSTCSTGQ
jgi:hypothetical protein